MFLHHDVLHWCWTFTWMTNGYFWCTFRQIVISISGSVRQRGILQELIKQGGGGAYASNTIIFKLLFLFVKVLCQHWKHYIGEPLFSWAKTICRLHHQDIKEWNWKIISNLRKQVALHPYPARIFLYSFIHVMWIDNVGLSTLSQI